jgi:hypothetical protein
VSIETHHADGEGGIEVPVPGKTTYILGCYFLVKVADYKGRLLDISAGKRIYAPGTWGAGRDTK